MVLVPAVGDQIPASLLDAAAVGLNPWSTYTPTVTGSTTSPTLGTGNSATGRYIVMGKTIIGEATIVWGTSGTVAGSGFYTISLPVTASAATPSTTLIGEGRVRCNGLYTSVKCRLITTGSVVMEYINAAINGALLNPGGALPGAWTANDEMRITFCYEAA